MKFHEDEVLVQMEDYLKYSHTTAVPEEFLVEIGRAVANFALLEWQLIQLIHLLLRTERNITRILTSELSFRGLQDLSMALVKEVFGDKEAEEYKQVLKLVSQAEAERNIVSHSLWGSGLSNGKKVVIRTKITAKRRKGLSKQRQELTGDDLRAIARKISVAIHELDLFRSRLGVGKPEWI